MVNATAAMEKNAAVVRIANAVAKRTSLALAMVNVTMNVAVTENKLNGEDYGTAIS